MKTIKLELSEQLKNANVDHSNQIKTLQSDHSEQMKTLQSDHSQQIKSARDEHHEALAALNRDIQDLAQKGGYQMIGHIGVVLCTSYCPNFFLFHKFYTPPPQKVIKLPNWQHNFRNQETILDLKKTGFPR